MDRTIRLLVLVVFIGACSAGNGYNYIKPANNVANIGPVVNSDGSTKSVHFFADSDDRQNYQRFQQQRPITYAKSVPYSRPITTYSQPTPQPSRIVYNRVAPQQSYVAPQKSYVAAQTYVAPQKSYVPPQQSYVAPQQSTITYNQIAQPQQKSVTYSQVAPQQQISFGSNQVASQQLPFLTSQTISQQSPISYNQVALQQQPLVYNQIIPQQLPITYTQVAPLQQQLYYTNYPTAPLRQNLQVVFVRTPGYEAYTEALLKMAKEAIQSQTIVYVLSKEPDIAELTRRFKEIQATARKMPEVRFVKYKTDDEAVQAQQAIQAQYEGLPGTSNTIGTPIGTEIGTGTQTQTETETETGSINYSNGATSETSSVLSTATTNNEDDSYSESFPPYVPTGVDVVPGSSYLPPSQNKN